LRYLFCIYSGMINQEYLYILPFSCPIMVLNMIMLVVVLIVLLIGSYTDIRTREVPDWVNYGLIFSALGIRLIYSAAESDWSYIIEGAFGFIVFLALAYAMFYAGQWGGGDAKMVMGLGAMLGLRFNVLDFSISFLANTFLVGAIYGLIWTLSLALIRWPVFKRELVKVMYSQKMIRIRKVVIISSIVIFILAFLLDDLTQKILVFTFSIFFLATYYLWVFIRAVENSCMYKLVEPERLTEGDWIAKDIIVGGKKICGPKDLGIEMKQIKMLIKLKKQKKINRILIKEGIPFVPSFLLAFIATYLWGNLFLGILG